MVSFGPLDLQVETPLSGASMNMCLLGGVLSAVGPVGLVPVFFSGLGLDVLGLGVWVWVCVGSACVGWCAPAGCARVEALDGVELLLPEAAVCSEVACLCFFDEQVVCLCFCASPPPIVASVTTSDATLTIGNTPECTVRRKGARRWSAEDTPDNNCNSVQRCVIRINTAGAMRMVREHVP